MNVYNIIWADDEIDDFLDERYESRLLRKGFKVIGKAHNGEELEERLKNTSFIDAVIVDANFNESSNSVENEREVSGLDYARNLYRHVVKYSIPFFLYTGRTDELLQEIAKKERPNLLKDFRRRENWFSKTLNERDEMLEAIKNEVERRNTPEFRIHNKYAREFEAAELIDEATENLQRGLLYLYEGDNWKNVQDYFNPSRKIVERIMKKCKEKNLLPAKLSLNDASRMFSGIDCGCKFKKNIMPKPLAESLFYFLKITQDGSHDDMDMSLGVDEYVRETKNINLYRTILYIAMDLLLWYESISKHNWDEEEQIWEYNFIYTGEVSQLGKYTLYTGKYELASRDTALKVGDIVGIIKSEKKQYPKGTLTEYVKNGNYKIIS